MLLLLAGPAMASADPVIAAAPVDRAALTKSLQTIVDDYLAKNAGAEGFTAISASVSLAGGKDAPIDVVAGRVSRAADAAPVTPETLFPIGSITKSMTSVVILQLVHEGALSLDAPIARWFPEYPAWGSVTLQHLLDMTSGIPSYDNTDAFSRTLGTYGIDRHFSPAVLLSFTDPDLPGAPKPTTGFDYANVNYIIAQMVVERATGRNLDEATPADNRGFGLGVGQTIAGGVRLWFYEGEPMGSRMFYGYFPEKNLVIVIAVNSAGGPDNISRALIAMHEAVTGEKIVAAARTHE